MIRLARGVMIVLGLASEAAAQPVASDAPVTSRSEREVCDSVEALITAHRLTEAHAALDEELSRRAIDRSSTNALAVLLRLVDAMTRPEAPALPPPPIVVPPPPPPRRNEREGLEVGALYATTISYGLATGAWLDAQFDITDPKALPWLPLVGAGAGAVVAYLADNPRSVRSGAPTALGAGLTLGLLGGASLGLQGWRANEWGVPTMTTVAWAGATVGLGAGIGLAALTEPRPSTSAFILSGGFWGTVLGFMTGYATGDDDHFGSFALVCEAIGVAAAAATAGILRPTHAQVRWMDLGALTGALVGFGVGFLLLRDERAPFAASVELGMVGGGVAGFLFGASREGPSRNVMGASRAFAWHPSVVPTQGGAMISLTGM